MCIGIGMMIGIGLEGGIYLFNLLFIMYFIIVATTQSSPGVYLASCPFDTDGLCFQRDIDQNIKVTSHVWLQPR
jgi:hypothetical protein